MQSVWLILVKLVLAFHISTGHQGEFKKLDKSTITVKEVDQRIE